LIIPELWVSLEFGIWFWFTIFILRYAVSFALVLYFYGYKVDKCNLFVLPLSFVPLPFIFLPVIMLSGAGNWPTLYAIREVAFFSGIFFFLTIIISVVLHIRKKKRQGLSCYQSEKTPKRIVLTGCLVFITLTAIYLSYIIGIEMHQQRIQLHTTYTEVIAIDMEDEWTNVHTDFLGTLPPDASIFDISLRSVSKRIENSKTQHDFESAFNVTLAEIDFKEYYYLVLVGQKAPPNLEHGWRTERLENVNVVMVYRVNIVR